MLKRNTWHKLIFLGGRKKQKPKFCGQRFNGYFNSFYMINSRLSNKTFFVNGPGTMPLFVLTKLSNLGKQAAPVAGEVSFNVNSLCIIKMVV